MLAAGCTTGCTSDAELAEIATRLRASLTAEQRRRLASLLAGGEPQG